MNRLLLTTARLVTPAVIVAVTLLACGCGGGFGSDSDNADALAEPVFGPSADSVSHVSPGKSDCVAAGRMVQ